MSDTGFHMMHAEGLPGSPDITQNKAQSGKRESVYAGCAFFVRRQGETVK
jgi:hypothetical protein